MTARLLFIGLWCLADRNGILEYRPKRIKAKLFPYDSFNLIKFLEEVSTTGLIVIWVDNDQNGHFIEIPNFLKHQKPHPNEKSSNLREMLDSSDHLIKLHEIKCNYRLILGMRKEERGISTPGPVASFDEFYKAYPKKKGKALAQKAWNKLSPSPELLEQILKAIIIQADSEDWTKNDGKYIPHPATWLNTRRWEDEECKDQKPERRWVENEQTATT